MAQLLAKVKLVHQHNVQVLRASPWAELSGAMGDLGTLLPLMLAMALQGSIDLSSTLVFSGLANILTGVLFGIPLPVQPMKAIASVAISQHMTRAETSAAGLTMGFAILFLSVTGLLQRLHRIVPVAVVKGIQVGAGLALIVNAGTSMIRPLTLSDPATDNIILAVTAFLLLAVVISSIRFPYALVMTLIGLAISIAVSDSENDRTHFGIWRPHLTIPSANAWKIGAVNAAVPQLPLTTLNSILAVSALSDSLFPNHPGETNPTYVGLSVATSNLVACWFGAMPMCHGSGGLAGQYFFGARSGASVIMLGIVKLILGLFFGEQIAPYLRGFPKSILGIMVIAAGLELVKVAQTLSPDLWHQAAREQVDRRTDGDKREFYEKEDKDRWTVMLVTTAGCLACKNDAIGFLAGLAWHWIMQLSKWIERRRRQGNIRLPIDQDLDRTHEH